MNVSTSLDVMVKLGVFEKMPKLGHGSMTAKEIGELVNLEPSIIGRTSILPNGATLTTK